MVTNVQQLTQNRYLINESAVISDFEFTKDGVKYKVEYDSDVITSSEANELAESFIYKTIKV